jgi:hypothetical protein
MGNRVMAASAIVSSAGAIAPAHAVPSWSTHQRGGSSKTASISDVDAQSSSVAPAKGGHAGQKIDRLA